MAGICSLPHHWQPRALLERVRNAVFSQRFGAGAPIIFSIDIRRVHKDIPSGCYARRPQAEGPRPLAGAEAAHHRIHHGLKDGQRVLHRRVDDVEQRIDLADLPATDPRVPDQRLVEQPSLLEEDPVR